jgi:hypothetical protein
MCANCYRPSDWEKRKMFCHVEEVMKSDWVLTKARSKGTVSVKGAPPLALEIGYLHMF